MTRAGALKYLAIAGWVVLAIPPALYAGLTLIISVAMLVKGLGWPLDLSGLGTAVVMLAAVGSGGFKYVKGDVRQGWILLALAWIPLLLTVVWGLFGA
ncbi:MAG: hypothetical protein EON85_14420 [Brevundimonas sp.]|nr:MAG: hypothetical protein EON85_14420 [Brevundimonas sp.]